MRAKARRLAALAAAAVAICECGSSGSKGGSVDGSTSGAARSGFGDASTSGSGLDATVAADDSGGSPMSIDGPGGEAADDSIAEAAHEPPADAGATEDALVGDDAEASTEPGGEPDGPVTDGAGGPCTAASLAPGDYAQTLALEGGARTFSVHVPPGLDPSKPAPAVFAFHGGGEDAVEFEGFAHIHAKSDASGFLLVEADGTPAFGPSSGTPPPADSGLVLNVWNAGNCCEYAAAYNGNVDDLGFVGKMIDWLEAQTCVDPKRVFATGFSNGGMLSHRLACQLSDRIAAIAAVSGGSGQTDYDKTPNETLFPCNPSRAVPVLHIHGTHDACYPFDGGWGPLSLVTFESVGVTIQNWLTRNGCEAGAPTTVLRNGAASCQLYPCPKEGEVELCVVDGGGHYWPGGDDWAGSTVVCGNNQGIRSADIVANDALWTWFQDHPMP